jgi:hypothetical protein
MLSHGGALLCIGFIDEMDAIATINVLKYKRVQIVWRYSIELLIATGTVCFVDILDLALLRTSG